MLQTMRFLLVVCLVTTIPTVLAYRFDLLVGEKVCFHEKFSFDSTVSFSYEVISGGFMDANVYVISPYEDTIYEWTSSSSNKVMFPAGIDGTYKVCFSNEGGVSQQQKDVMFHLSTARLKPVLSINETDNKQKSLLEMVSKLNEMIAGVSVNQEYLKMRQIWHVILNQATNQQVLNWAVFELLGMAVMTGFQIWYLKKFFEVRTYV